MRGKPQSFLAKIAVMGSSPLTRGTLRTLRAAAAGVGLIPAHTGKTASSKSHRPRTRAHPHSCGENVTLLPQQSAQPGSSPLTRGKPSLVGGVVAGDRAHPRSRGKTCEFQLAGRRAWAHPHSRGENFVIEIVSMRTPGSSPLMRGKHGHVSNWQNPHGLIPTHAGKTLARAARSRQRGAHPRSHGENQPRVRRHTPPPGSSPLTRGKPQDVWIERLQERLIPTHAGKTIRRAFRGRRSGAHPHSCGENMVSDGKVSLEDGSSPLTRGKPGSATA